MLAGVLRALGYRGPLAQPWLRLGALALALALALVLAATAYAAVRALLPPVSALAPATSFELEGPLEAVSEAGLVVAGIAVDLGPQTAISGTPAVGAAAQVRGQIRDDGTLLAETVVVGAAAAAGGSPTVGATAPPAPSATSAPAAVATAPPSAAPAAPTAAPAAAPPPAPTAAPPPAPSGDPLVLLRRLLEAGVADGRAGEQGRELLSKLSEAERALADGNSKKAGDQLRDLYQKLREQARAGKADPAFAEEAQALIAAVGEAYGLRPLPDEGGGKDDDDDKDDKDDKNDD